MILVIGCVLLAFSIVNSALIKNMKTLSILKGHHPPVTSPRLHQPTINDILRQKQLQFSLSHCERDFAAFPIKIIIAGAPAAGKGTQCELLKSKYNLIHVSTGELLRSAVVENSELGMQVKPYLDSAKLVPDDLISQLVCDRLRQVNSRGQGWLLDGFPRTEAQTLALESAGIRADCFVLLDVDEKVLVSRVLGRRVDPVTGMVYHLEHNRPTSKEVLARLVRRSDDSSDKLMRRLGDFKRHIGQVLSAFEHILLTVDGGGSDKNHEEVHADLCKKLNTMLKRKQASTDDSDGHCLSS